MVTKEVFIKRFDEILKAEQETAYTYKNIYDNYIKRFGTDDISKRLYAIYTVELEHISIASKLLQIVH